MQNYRDLQTVLYYVQYCNCSLQNVQHIWCAQIAAAWLHVAIHFDQKKEDLKCQKNTQTSVTKTSCKQMTLANMLQPFCFQKKVRSTKTSQQRLLCLLELQMFHASSLKTLSLEISFQNWNHDTLYQEGVKLDRRYFKQQLE